MGQPYAEGSKARGFCDRCGFDYLLHELRSEVIDMMKSGLLVCPECWDPDSPQYQLGRFPINDPQALRNPRPTGSSAGGPDTKHRYDFETDRDYWVPLASTLTWNSSDKTVTLGDVGADAYIQRTAASLGSSAVDIDASPGDDQYRVVRCRFKPDARSSPISAWHGQLFWNRSTDGSSFGGGRSLRSISPDFNSMGDPWKLVSWNVWKHSEWSGTVVALRLDFFDFRTSEGGPIPGYVAGDIKIDYITVEKE